MLQLIMRHNRECRGHRPLFAGRFNPVAKKRVHLFSL